MIENIPTYEELLQRCLDRIPNTIDKRQGSIIFDALAPCCLELAQFYVILENVYKQVFIDTASGENLDNLVKQNGMKRKEATNAIRKGEFNIKVPISTRFTDGKNTYIVIENIEGTNNSKLKCEQPGQVGNSYYGPLTPISFLTDLDKAELTDIIELGNEKEDDEELRKRYMEEVTLPQYGGNISDYQNKTKSIIGVGACKVIPIWNGAGTVKLIILNGNYEVPDNSLISKVQKIIDPNLDQSGIGIAPIGHIVTVVGAESKDISISANFSLKPSIEKNIIKQKGNKIIDDYFKELTKEWDKEDSLIVRISQIESRLLDIEGVIDITNLKLNNSSSNISLTSNEIPKRNGDMIINE
nr:MAG TPA: Baseplate J like protein [Caudoviricetes sp.]